MNKSELIDDIRGKTPANLKQIDAILTAALDTIIEAVSSGDKVALIGFGSFDLRERQEREGRNPKTGAPVRIPAKKVPGFSAGKVFRDKVKPSA